MSARTLLALVDIAHPENALNLLREAARQTGPEDTLHVAYVMPYGHFSYVEPFVSEQSIKSSADRAHSALHALVDRAGLQAEEHVLRGGVGEQGILLAEKLPADLILLNAHRPDVRIHTLGSYATQIIRHAPCSTLVVRVSST